MTTKLRWVCLGWMSLGACGDVGGPEPSTFLLPSVDPMGVPGVNGSLDTNVACIIRYDYAGDDMDVECRTEHVNGDPSHWITTCPEPHFWLEEEVRLDESGRTVFRRGIATNPTANYSQEITYDELGRLVRSVHNGSLEGESIFTVDAYDDAGRPLHGTSEGPDWVSPRDEPVPGTGSQVASYAYDTHGRLTFVEWSFVSSGAAHWSRTITYDDAARRRNEQRVVDLTSVGLSPVPTVVGGYDLFDAEGRPVEDYWAVSPDLDARTGTYRYDEQGRLLTHTEFHDGDPPSQFVAHYIYDCQ